MGQRLMNKLDKLVELLIVQTEAQLEINKLNAQRIAELTVRLDEMETFKVSQNGFDASQYIK